MTITIDDIALKSIKSLYKDYEDKRRRVLENNSFPEELNRFADMYLMGQQDAILQVLDRLGIIYSVFDEDGLVI